MITPKNYRAFEKALDSVNHRKYYHATFSVGDRVKQNKLYHFCIGKQAWKWAIVQRRLDRFEILVKTNTGDLVAIGDVFIDKERK